MKKKQIGARGRGTAYPMGVSSFCICGGCLLTKKTSHAPQPQIKVQKISRLAPWYQAAKDAQIYSALSELPQQFDTFVGLGGGPSSGKCEGKGGVKRMVIKILILITLSL